MGIQMGKCIVSYICQCKTIGNIQWPEKLPKEPRNKILFLDYTQKHLPVGVYTYR